MLAFLFMAASCWADGMVMQSTAVPVEAHIPDQRALIQFSNGVERLVIETRFTGAGTNFAWVVPLPSAPVIEEASIGLFPTLQSIFQPRLRHEVTRYFQLFLGLLAFGYLLRFVQRRSPLNCLDVLACLGVGLAVFAPDPHRGFGSIVIFMALLYVVECLRLGTPNLTRAVTFFFAILFLGFMLLPPLGARTAGISSSSTPTLFVIDRKMVGIFDTATISSHDPAALQVWLKANGFAAPASRDQAIASYVKDGWVFVAAKIRRVDSSLQTATPHPLSFTFKTAKAVYPMRLTGIDNGPVQVDLYVFGPDQAEAPHFQVERCTHPMYPSLPVHKDAGTAFFYYGFQESDHLDIVHPLLRKWVDGAGVATKLTATLSPANMHDDIWISWTPFSEKRPTRFSNHGAMIYAANWGAGVIAISLLAMFVFGQSSENRAKCPARFVSAVTGSGIILAVIVYFLVPKTEVRIVRGYRTPRMETFEKLEIIQIIASQETNLTEVRVRIAYDPSMQQCTNYLSGGLVREEDSPGNYQLRQAGNRVECVIYDASGAPSSDF